MSDALDLPQRIQNEIVELSSSIGGLVDSFRKLRHPLKESHEKVPQATNQLDKISEQTEAAAHHMLDIIENMTQRETEIIGLIKAVKNAVEENEVTEVAAKLEKMAGVANDNLNDAYMIMDALQFQDITSQQMDHAASLLDDIESKLHVIMSSIDTEGAAESEQISIAGQPSKKRRAFDPHADLFDKRTEQKDIDSLFEKRNQE